ncbi:Zinc finger BED domain-containing protein DAYSLEEPER [Euphorbia peplus]|nr:Zinc finger BED domain-containing protein DAYSLEEPER [Euphorbia peplus]
MFFPKICDIKVALTKWETSGSMYFDTMASNMVEKFDKYWDEVHEIMSVAIVLDPRFKLWFLEYYYPILFGEEASKLKIQRIKNICSDLITEYVGKTKESKFANSSNKEDWLAKFELFLASRGTQKYKSAKAEFDYYLEEDVVPRTLNFDILSWWSQAYKYPTLKLIARDILAIPISTVVSEHAFGSNERVMSNYRSKLHPETIEALMCTQNWIWSEKKDTRVSTKILAQYCELFDDEVNEEDAMLSIGRPVLKR